MDGGDCVPVSTRLVPKAWFSSLLPSCAMPLTYLVNSMSKGTPDPLCLTEDYTLPLTLYSLQQAGSDGTDTLMSLQQLSTLCLISYPGICTALKYG